MQLSITILVATMTGTADLVAEEVSAWIRDGGGSVEILSTQDLAPSALEPGRLYLVCSSTYGQGDVPDNARDFATALERERPDLAGLSFGLIALGDSTYRETFCYGGKRFQALLTGLGATLVGEPLYHDASSGTLPEEEALTWLESWVEEVPELLRSAA